MLPSKLAEEIKYYKLENRDKLRMIQSQIKRRNGSRKAIQPIVDIVLSFIEHKGYAINDTKAIIKAIGFDMPDEYIDLIEKKVQSTLDKEMSKLNQQTKKQEEFSNYQMSSIKEQGKAFHAKHADKIEDVKISYWYDGGYAVASHLDAVVSLLQSFCDTYHHYDSDSISQYLKAIGFTDLSFAQLGYIESCVGPILDGHSEAKQEEPKQQLKEQAKKQAKQTKKQEVAQYPPRFTTSKPTPPKEMTTTNRPKLNLSHIQQVHQPAKVSPSESTRKPSKKDYYAGVVKGIEVDDRIWNSEVKAYKKALTKLRDANKLSQLPSKSGIHSTNDAREAVRGLVPSGRLTSWR